MGNFSLNKLKESFTRRPSEPLPITTSLSHSVEKRSSNGSLFSPETSSTLLTQAIRRLESAERTSARSRSRSVSKREKRILIRQETSQVILKKILHVLEDAGAQLPITLETYENAFTMAPSKNVKIHIANSSDCVYLPASRSKASIADEFEHGPGDLDEEEDTDDYLDNLDPVDRFRAAFNNGHIFEQKMRNATSPNYLCSEVESDTLIPHLFAVIAEVGPGQIMLSKLEVTFRSDVKTEWPDCENGSIMPSKESFGIASHTWSLDWDDADYFISNVNSNERFDRKTKSADLANRSTVYSLIDAKTTSTVPPVFPEQKLKDVKAGLYLFFLPIIFPSNIPSTVRTLNGSLTHKLFIDIPYETEKHLKKSTVHASYELPMVRAPPPLATSILDKPIHVTRTWSDSLHYMITFPRKYVSLGSEHIINVKLIPLAKDVVVKRIKFNVLESVRYLSRDCSKEYEYDSSRHSVTKLRGLKAKDRVFPLCELKTKQKSYDGSTSVPFKQEIIKCQNNNLLNACYEQKSLSSGEVVISSPLDINVALPFLTSKAEKEFLTSPESRSHSRSPTRGSMSSKRDSTFNPEIISSDLIGSLETKVGHPECPLNLVEAKKHKISLNSSSYAVGHEINKEEGSTIDTKALSPDSNFKHIQISHRLQISFRVSKPDSMQNFKLRHYEIVIDTPLTLLSSKCNEGSTQLPNYEEILSSSNTADNSSSSEIKFRIPQYSGNGVLIKQLGFNSGERLPSFEEATSTLNSPKLVHPTSHLPHESISNQNLLSQTNTPIASTEVSPFSHKILPELAPAYDQGYFTYSSNSQTHDESLSPLARNFGNRKPASLSSYDSSSSSSPSLPLSLSDDATIDRRGSISSVESLADVGLSKALAEPPSLDTLIIGL